MPAVDMLQEGTGFHDDGLLCLEGLHSKEPVVWSSPYISLGSIFSGYVQCDVCG